MQASTVNHMKKTGQRYAAGKNDSANLSHIKSQVQIYSPNKKDPTASSAGFHQLKESRTKVHSQLGQHTTTGMMPKSKSYVA